MAVYLFLPPFPPVVFSSSVYILMSSSLSSCFKRFAGARPGLQQQPVLYQLVPSFAPFPIAGPTWQQLADIRDASAKAAAELPCTAVIDANDPIFEKPGAMPERIAMLCEKSNQQVPQSPAAYARCIFDSLADAYVKVLAQLQSAAGVKINAINIVGGGSANRLLNQLTADATGLPVYAGPSEATVLGSIMVQMQSMGAIKSLSHGRQIIKDSITQEVFKPRN